MTAWTGQRRRRGDWASTPLDDTAREMVERYIPLARKLAARFSWKWPRHRPEILSAAFWGLVNAAATFRQGKKTSFMTYAYKRISWAIYDEIRKENDQPHIASSMITADWENAISALATSSALDLDPPGDSILRRLPRRNADALRLIALGGQSQASAAAILGCSQVEVGRRIAQCRELLGGSHACLETEGRPVDRNYRPGRPRAPDQGMPD